MYIFLKVFSPKDKGFGIKWGLEKLIMFVIKGRGKSMQNQGQWNG